MTSIQNHHSCNKNISYGVIQFELFPNRTLHLYLFHQVENSMDIRKKLLSKELVEDYALIDASMVINLFQIEVAAVQTLLNASRNNLITNTIHSELVYNLSGSRNVSEAFRHFGISDQTKELLIGVFDPSTNFTPDGLQDFIVGNFVSIHEIGKKVDPMRLQKHYKIHVNEIKTSSLLDAIITRISTKSCLQ